MAELGSGEKRVPLLTAATLGDVVAAQLHSLGMPEVAAEVCRMAETTPATGGNGDSRGLQNDASAAVVSISPPNALEWILGASHVVTRAQIQRLLSQGESKLREQLRSMGLPPPNVFSLHYVLYPNKRYMWSAQDDADEIYVSGVNGAKRGMHMFATLHQLIEELTRVTVLSLSTVSDEEQKAQQRFTHTFLRQHRYFASSHAVLAKLMERFLVPLSVKLGFEHFEGHGITIHAPGTSLMPSMSTSRTAPGADEEEGQERCKSYFSQSATLWLSVCQKIQTRVLSVLALWLREYPHHFDNEMLQCINHFLDDSAYCPQPWSDCPSQLAQMAEFVRACSVKCAAAMKVERNSNFGKSTGHHQPVASPPTCEASSWQHTASATNAVDGNSFSEHTHDDPLSILSPCRVRGCSMSSLLGDHWPDVVKEVVKLCITTPVEQYATTLTAIHRRLFASLHVEDLLQVVHRFTMPYACSQSFRSSPIGNFLSSSTDLSSWVVSVLLHAAVLDSIQLRMASDALKLKSNFVDVHTYFVNLIVSLVRQNNLHGALGVYQGVQHPLVQRTFKHPRMLSLIPASTLQNIARLAPLLGADEEEVGRNDTNTQRIDEYMDGILDTDVLPPVPPVKRHFALMREVQHEMPSFLTLNTDDMYPPSTSGELPQTIVVIHWRKYMILDQLAAQALRWHDAPTKVTTFKTQEYTFVVQQKKVIHQPWKLARMAHELFSVL